MKRKVLRVFCIVGIIASMLSGCGLRMTPEDKIQLFARENKVMIAEDVKIEQLESLQFSQMTVNAPPYSEALIGELFMGLSESEVNRKITEYQKNTAAEFGISEEEVKEWNALLIDGDASAGRADGGFNYVSSQDAKLYQNAVYMIHWLFLPNANGVSVSSAYHYEALSSVFTKEQLDWCTKEQARQEADPIAMALGYSLEQSEIYTLDVDTLNQISEVTGLPIPGSVREKNGTVISAPSTWTKEQEAYLILYKQTVEGRVLESVAAENILFLYYHPQDKIIFAETDRPALGTKMKEQTTKTVMTGEEALQTAQIYFSGQEDGKCTITEVTFGYMCPDANLNLTENTMILQPCWKITYRYTSSGKEIQDHILLNAETGEMARNNIMY